MSEEISLRAKIDALSRVARFNPLFTFGIIVLSVFAALLEGIGLSFLLPIIQQARGGEEPSGLVEVFMSVYDALGVPFTLEYIIAGVTLVMVLRYVSTFLVAWLRAALRTYYVRDLQVRSYDSALDAKVSYFDQKGSDEILNAIVTQSRKAGSSILRLVRIVEQGCVSLMYFSIALYLAPKLSVATAVVLGGITIVVQNGFESGYSVGDRVAEANERVQTACTAV
jgi:subfamily B ATP-binding cassette protein MsbA